MPNDRSDTTRERVRWEQDRMVVQACFGALAPRLDTVISQFYARLFALAPETRDLFPVNMQAHRSRFARMLIHLVQTLERPAELEAVLRQLAEDHRKFDVHARHYPVFGHALLAALAEAAGADWTAATAGAWQRLFAWTANAMTTAAATASGPASYSGYVTGHHRLDRDTALVEIHPDPPVPYQPGQYVSVEIPQRPRLWRYLSPATAPPSTGRAESLIFYVKALGSGGVARAIVNSTELGDRWRLGPPRGTLHYQITPFPRRDLLLVGGGTGIAPILSILDHLTQAATGPVQPVQREAPLASPNAATTTSAIGTSPHPSVVVCYGAADRRRLHALAGLRELTFEHPWLTLLPVTEEHPAPAGFHSGTLADVITRYGSWADREVILSGSPFMLRHTVARMLVAGTSATNIHYDPFVHD
jgi:NAD(P)H-flavin reductase